MLCCLISSAVNRCRISSAPDRNCGRHSTTQPAPCSCPTTSSLTRRCFCSSTVPPTMAPAFAAAPATSSSVLAHQAWLCGRLSRRLQGATGTIAAAPIPSRLAPRISTTSHSSRAVIRLAQERLGTDPRKVLAVGFSNGASMVYRLALERPEMVAADRRDRRQSAGQGQYDLPRGRPRPVGGDDPERARRIHWFLTRAARWTIFGMNSRGYVVSSEESAAYFVHLNGLNGRRARGCLADPG